MKNRVNRRCFLQILGASGVAAMLGWPFVGARRSKAAGATGGITAYRRSGRGRHVSRAAKAHNANHLYATAQAAAADRPHPGDTSKVVPVVISAALFAALFRDGRQSVDLRHDLHTLNDFAGLGQCLTGPGAQSSSSCASEDLNGDAALDLRDVAASQRIFTGS